MTYLELIALINQWIITNGNREITAAVLNPVLRAMTDWVLSVTGVLSELNTANKSNLVLAINEVNTNFGNINITGSQVYSGLDNPNTTPPPSYKAADFYLQIDSFNNPIALFLYDGTVWQNVTSVFEGLKTPVNIRVVYNGFSAAVPVGFVLTRVVSLNDINTEYIGNVIGATVEITDGVSGDIYLIDGYTP